MPIESGLSHEPPERGPEDEAEALPREEPQAPDDPDPGPGHVNSGPPGHANQPGHANFDPGPGHVNSGPPGHANQPGHANFNPGGFDGGVITLPNGLKVQGVGNRLVLTVPGAGRVTLPVSVLHAFAGSSSGQLLSTAVRTTMARRGGSAAGRITVTLPGGQRLTITRR